MTELIPLSPFADIPGRRWTAPPLSPDKYDPDTLERLMRYLECSPMILPWKVIQGVVLKEYSASAAVMVCSNVSRGRR